MFSDALEVLRTSESQWIIFTAFGACFWTLQFHQARTTSNPFWAVDNPRFWASGLMATNAFSYFSDYLVASRFADPITLLATATIAKAIAVGISFQNRVSLVRSLCVLFISTAFISILGLAGNLETKFKYYYRGLARWTGPFSTPNTFGILMAV